MSNEQKVMSNVQKVTSNEQSVTSNEQKTTSKTSNEQKVSPIILFGYVTKIFHAYQDC